jgi:5-hydroxyisourate hydrolase-like protein (transthyretin family)
MRSQRKGPQPAPAAAGSEFSRKLNALVLLLEDKGVLEPGEFEDAVMNLKIQLADQMPPAGKVQPGRNGGRRGRSGNDYVGPERRQVLGSDRGTGQERRTQRTAVAHISGEILSEETGQPVSGVQLILRRTGDGGAPIQYRSTKSDMQGRYVFLNLPLSKENESVIGYIYHLEARYRNRTLHTESDLPLQPDQTIHHPLRLPLQEA